MYTCRKLISIYSHLMTVMIAKAGARLHEALLKSAAGARLSYLTETDTGVILNRYGHSSRLNPSYSSTNILILRFSQDIEMIDDSFPNALLELCASTWFERILNP